MRRERQHTGHGFGETERRAGAGSAPADRKYLLERVDDAAVVQLYADGFKSLPLDEKRLIWHLYQAALAGRDIYYDQRYAHNLEMRDILEEIITHPTGVDPETLAEIQRYTKLFWLNTGPYNNLTARKFVLKCTPQAFAAAAKAAAQAGAKFPSADGESLDALLARLQPSFFDPAVDPLVTNKTPGAGKDILTTSANNLYVGVSMKDVDKLRRTLSAELPRRQGPEARRGARRGGVPRRRPLRQGDPGDRRSPRGGDPVTRRRRWRRRSARSSSSTRPARRPIASRTTSPGSRTRPRRSTRSTASSRSTWTRAA